MQSHLTGDCDVVAVARWVGVAPQLSLCQGCSVSQSIKRARERGTERLGRRERRREVERVSSLCDRAMSNLAGLGDGLTGSVIDIWFHEEFRCGPREYYSLYSHTSHTVCVKVFLCTRANVCVCVCVHPFTDACAFAWLQTKFIAFELTVWIDLFQCWWLCILALTYMTLLLSLRFCV